MIDRVKQNLDIVLAIIGLACLVLLSALMLYLSFNIAYIVAFGIGIVCIVIYLFSRNRLSLDFKGFDWHFYISLAFIFIALSLAFYIARNQQYVKPTLYYIFYAVSVIFIFMSALAVQNKKQVIISLSVIGILALMNVWTECMLFPSVIGMDAWVHLRIATEELPIAMGIKENLYGLAPLNIMTIGGYYSLFHLYIYELMALGLGYKMTVLIFWSSCQVVANIIFAYLIGNKLFNKRIGIVSALMIAIAGWVMFFNEWGIPNSIGITFCLIVAYLMLKFQDKKNYWFIVPVIFITLLSFMIHIIVSVWVIGVVACISIIPQLVGKGSFIKRIGKALIMPVCLILAFALWLNFTFLGVALTTSVAVAGDYKPESGLTYPLGKAPDLAPVTPSITPSNNSDSVTPNNNVIAKPIEQVQLVSDQLSKSVNEIIVDSIGMFLYIGFAIIGSLIMIRGKPNLTNITWIILCYGVLFIGILPPLVGKSLIEHRWWSLAQSFMAIPLAVALVGLCNATKGKYIIIGFLVGVIAFMSAIGLPSNISNRVFSQNLIVRYGFTEKELEGFVVAETYKPKIVGADSFYLSYVQSHARWCNPKTVESGNADSNIMSGNFKDCVIDVIVLRDSIYKEPFAFGSGSIYKVNYNPIEVAKTQGYKEVYDNGEVHCLIKE